MKDLRKTCATYHDEHVPESSVELVIRNCPWGAHLVDYDVHAMESRKVALAGEREAERRL